MEIKNKVAIVTGASEGIGKAIAEALYSQGAKLIVAARSDEKIQAIVKKLPGSQGVHVDMRQEKDVQYLIEMAMKTFGRIDLLVNNAGQGLYGSLETINLNDYQGLFELNVQGPLRAMQLVIPQMRKQGGGMIVNVSSMVSKNAYPFLGAYASTKYALNALSLTARAELAKDHIVVSLLHPRMTATRFGENSLGSRPDFTSRGGTPLPVDTPEMVAQKLLGLVASEAAEATMP